MATANESAKPLEVLVIRGLHDRLNDCRRACPGIGGDIDAANLRHLLDHNEWDEIAVKQAAHTLEGLTRSLTLGVNAEIEIKAVDQVLAMNAIPQA